MAKIPLLNLRTRVNPSPAKDPTKSVSQSGIKARAVGKLAQQATNFVSEIAERRNQAEVVNYRNSSVSEFNRESRLKLDELRQNNAGTDFSGHSQDYSTWQKEKLNGIRKNAPNSRALQAFNSSVIASENNRLVDAENEERFNRAKVFTSADRNRTLQMAQDALSNPNLVEISSDLELEESWVLANRDLYYNGRKDATDAVLEEKFSSVRRGAIQGTINQGLVGIVTPGLSQDKQVKEIDAFLAGKDPKTKALLKGITAQESQSYRRQMLSQLNNTSRQNTKMLREEVKNLTVLNMDNSSDPVKNSILSESIFNRLQNVSDEGLKAEMIREVELSVVAGHVVRSTNTMTQEEFIQFKSNPPSIPSNITNAAEVKKYNDFISTSLAKIERKRKNNPKQYVREIVGDLSHYELFLEQKKLGLDAQYLDKNEAFLESSKILESASLEDRVLRLNEFKSGNPEGYRLAFREMSEVNDNFDVSYALAADMPEVATQRAIFSTVDKMPGTIESFKSVPEFNFIEDTMVDKIRLSLQDEEQIAAFNGGDVSFNSLRNLVLVRAKENYINPNSSTRGNADTSSIRAIESISNSSKIPLADTREIEYDSQERNFSRYMVDFPKNIFKDHEEEDLRDGLLDLLDDDSLKELGASVTFFPDFRGDEDSFFKVASESSTIIESEDGTGVNIMFRDRIKNGDGLWVDGGVSLLKKLDGSVITVPWEHFNDK